MSSVDFNKQVQELWNNKTKSAGKEKTPPNPLEQILADNQFSRKEYDTLLKAYKSQNPETTPEKFNEWLADMLDGKSDGQTRQALKEAVNHLSGGSGSAVSIAFNLNPAQNGYLSIAAVTLEKPDKELLAQLKSVDQDRNGRIESNERPKLQSALTELSQKGKASTEYNFLQAQAQDSFSTITYDEKFKTVTVFLTDAAPVMDNGRRDLRFTGNLYLEDIDGINDRSSHDLKGKINGQLTMDYDLLSRLFRQVLNPILPKGAGAYDSKYLSVTGGYSLSVGKEYFDDKRNAYVIKGTAAATAGAFGHSVSPSIDLEVLVSHNGQGEVTVSIPGLDESLIPGTGKLRDFILTQIEKVLHDEVNKKDVGIKFDLRQETLTETTTGFTSYFTGKPVTKELGRRLNLRPNMQLKLPNPFPTPSGEKAGTLDINLPTSSRDMRLTVDRKGVHVALRDTPIHGSTDSNRAAAQPDRSSDTADMKVDYGLKVDFGTGIIDHKVVVKDSTVKVDVQEGEFQDFSAIAKKHGIDPGKTGQLEMHLRGQAGKQNTLQGSVKVKTDTVDAFSHIQIQDGESGQTRTKVSLSGADLSYRHEQVQVKTKAKTGSVTLGGEGPVQVELYGVDGRLKVNLAVLKAIQAQIKSGHRDLIKLLEKTGLNPDFLQKLSAGSVKDLESLLQLDDFVKQFRHAAVALQAEKFDIRIQNGQVQSSASHVKAQTRISGGTAAAPSHVSVNSQAQSLSVTHDPEKSTKITTTATHIKGTLAATNHGTTIAATASGNAKRTDVILDQAGAVASLGVKSLSGKQTVAIDQKQGVHLQANLDSTGTQASLNLKTGKHRISSKTMHSSGQMALGDTAVTYSAAWQDTQAQILPNGHLKLSTPHVETATQIKTSVKQLKELAGRIGHEQLKTLLASDKENVLRESLKKVGLSSQDVDKAMGLLLHPRIREMLSTSEFVDALLKSDRLEITVLGQSALEVSSDASQTQVNLKQTQGVVSAGLGTQDHTLLHTDTQIINGELQTSSKGTTASAAQLRHESQGKRPNGDTVAGLKTIFTGVEAKVNADGHRLQVQETEISGELSTTLDAAKIEELQKLLDEVKVRVQERLKSFGLSKKQIESFVKAFGEEQLKNLFKSTNKKELQEILKQIGASDTQLKRLMKLLDEKQLNQVVEDIWQFTSVLKDAKAKLTVKTTAGATHWEQTRGQTDMATQGIQADVNVSTLGEQGQSEINVTGNLQKAQVRGSGKQWQTDWQGSQLHIDSQARKPGQNPTHNLHLTGQASLDQVTTHHGKDQRKTTIGTLNSQVKVDYSLPERSANAQVQGGFEGIEATTEHHEPKKSTQTTKGFNLGGQAHVKQQGAETNANARLKIGTMQTSPQAVHLNQTALSGNLNAKQTENGETSQGNIHGQVTLEKYDQTEQGVVGQNLNVTGNALLGTRKDDAVVTMRGHVAGGAKEFSANQGKVTVPEIHGQAEGAIEGPLANLDVQGKLNMTGVQSQNGHVQADTASIHDVQGSLRLKTDKLRSLFDKHPDAFKLLHQISENLDLPGKPSANAKPLIHSSDITIEFKDIALQGEKGNALGGQQTITGKIRVPAVETRFGKAEATLNLEKIALSEAKGNDIRVGGSVRFTPAKAEFERQVKQLLDKQLALSDLPNLNTKVTLENGQIRLQVDRWFLDGAVSVACEKDKLVVSVDKAKLIHLISAKGMVSGKVADQLSQRLIRFTQAEEKISISLKDLTKSLTHQENLQLTSVQLKKDNTFDIQFAYTDGKVFQSQQRQRDQQHLENTLFRDPLNGNRLREDGDLEDLIEDLPANTLQEIFQSASVKQARKVLTVVGKDYDDIIRKALGDGTNLTGYPIAIKALMAAYLANDRGIFESVDSAEKALIKKLYQPLKPEERKVFMATLTAAEQKRLKAFLP